jgi:hypothetical protein
VKVVAGVELGTQARCIGRIAEGGVESRSLHGVRRSILSVPPGYREIAVARDQIVFPMNERNGNIWMVE